MNHRIKPTASGFWWIGCGPAVFQKRKLKSTYGSRSSPPGDELRKWFAHDPGKWPEFKKKYREELEGKPDLLHQLRELAREHKTLTLLYAAKDEEHNNAVAPREIL